MTGGDGEGYSLNDCLSVSRSPCTRSSRSLSLSSWNPWETVSDDDDPSACVYLAPERPWRLASSGVRVWLSS